MNSYQWNNRDLTQIQIPENIRDKVLAYAQYLDLNSNGLDSYIFPVYQAIENQKTGYGDKFQEHILEQYKIYIEMADKVSSRRLQTNGFFITILSGLLGIIAFTFNKDTQLSADLQNLLLLIISVLGVFLCYVWGQAIKSYKILNSSKYTIINAIEQLLPCAGYYQEWQIAKLKQYNRATEIENKLAWYFMIFWIILLGYVLFSRLFPNIVNCVFPK